MGITLNQQQINQRKTISQGIRWWMSEVGLTLGELAFRTRCSKQYIKRVIDGEPVEIQVDFLRDLVLVFGRTGGRRRYFEETGVENLSWDECVRLIKSPPPRQAKFWD